MTSGSVSIKNFSWGLKSKKRHRSGSGGSKDHEAKKKSLAASRRQSTGSRKSLASTASSTTSASSRLELSAPITSDVEFKFTWPVEGFLRLVSRDQAQSIKGSTESIVDTGLDSDNFELNVNGVRTSWNLSIRFWTGENGERLANPFVLCLNMLSCTIDKPVVVGIRYKFGVLNRVDDKFEFCTPETKSNLRLETSDELKSVGYKNMSIADKHVNSNGDIELVCKMRVIKDDSEKHSLASDLRNLLTDPATTDMEIEASDGKRFKSHRNILAARSPVLAKMIVDNKDSNVLKLNDLSAETAEAMLTYIYTDDDSQLTVDKALLAAADRFGLAGLKQRCEAHFSDLLRPGNVASLLLLADTFACNDLKRAALDYCRSNHTYMMKDSAWKSLEDERPTLFEEAVEKVAGADECQCHSECLKTRGKKFQLEKNGSKNL